MKITDPNQIKILFVTAALDIGGTETHLVNLLPHLADEEFKPYVFSINGNGILGGELEQKGIKVFATWGILKIRRLPRIFRALLIPLFSIITLVTLLIRLRPHVIHMFLPAAYIVGGLATMFSPVPVRIMSRRSRNYYQIRHPFATRLELILHRQMSILLGNSKKVIEDLKSESNEFAKIRLIYNGITLHSLADDEGKFALRKSLGIDPHAIVFTMTANLISYKGHEDLIAAFKLIKNELGKNWCLLCIGGDRGLMDTLERTALSAEIDQHIRWLGSRRDVPAILSVSDVGVLSSHEEGFSNAVLEYMGSGLPSVVTNVGGNSEAVLHNVCGLVVDPHDPKALSVALLELSKNTHKRIQMGLAARSRVEAYFTLETSVDKYSSLYREEVAKVKLDTLHSDHDGQ
jgi:glycosyltransferase involved in cell wall biosynthesis